MFRLPLSHYQYHKVNKIQKFKFENSNSKIQIRKFIRWIKFKNSNSKIQIRKFKFKNSDLGYVGYFKLKNTTATAPFFTAPFITAPFITSPFITPPFLTPSLIKFSNFCSPSLVIV